MIKYFTAIAIALLISPLSAVSGWSAHAAVIISVPTTGSWSNETVGAFSATGTNSGDGFHFDARQVVEVQYITGTYNFAGFDTLDFTVKGQAAPSGAHIFWQLTSGSDVLTTGTDGGVINVNQLALSFADPAVSLSLFSLNGFTDFAVDLHAYSTAVEPVPLPATLPLFVTGLGGMGLMGWWRRRRRGQAAHA